MFNNYIKGFNLPSYIIFLLFILKFMYYYLNIIPFDYYNKYKNIIIDIGKGDIESIEDIKNKILNVYYIDNNNQTINI